MDANLLPCIVADILTLIYVVSLAVPGIEELETALSLAGIHGLCVQKARRPEGRILAIQRLCAWLVRNHHADYSEEFQG